LVLVVVLFVTLQLLGRKCFVTRENIDFLFFSSPSGDADVAAEEEDGEVEVTERVDGGLDGYGLVLLATTDADTIDDDVLVDGVGVGTTDDGIDGAVRDIPTTPSSLFGQTLA
jgi:hypothetical protein